MILGPNDSSVLFRLKLEQDPTAVTGLDFDAGLPALQMSFPASQSDPGQNQIDTTLGWTYEMNFGVDLTDGFFVDVSTTNPLTITIDATPVAGQTLTGVFNDLGAQATPTTLLVGTLPIPANGQLTANSTFTLTIDNNPAVSVTVPSPPRPTTARPATRRRLQRRSRRGGITNVAAVVKSVQLANGTTQTEPGVRPADRGECRRDDAEHDRERPHRHPARLRRRAEGRDHRVRRHVHDQRRQLRRRRRS